MTIAEIATKLDLKIISGETGANNPVTGGYSSDLLSDVMGNAKEGDIWITLQTHKNGLGVASLKDIAGIVLVNGFMPESDTIELSNKEGIPVLSTKLSNFEITGKLYNLLNEKI